MIFSWKLWPKGNRGRGFPIWDQILPPSFHWSEIRPINVMTHYWITPWREWIGIIHMCHSFVLLYRRQAMLVFSDDLSSVFFLSGFFPSFYSCIIWFLRYFPKVDIRVGTFLWTAYIYTYEYAWWGSFVLNKHIIIHITSDIAIKNKLFCFVVVSVSDKTLLLPFLKKGYIAV